MAEKAIDVLLVGDPEDHFVFFIHALEVSNSKVELCVARDGAEALALIFGAGNPDEAVPVVRPKVIVMDLKLSEVSGIVFLRTLKANPHTRSIPVTDLSSPEE